MDTNTHTPKSNSLYELMQLADQLHATLPQLDAIRTTLRGTRDTLNTLAPVIGQATDMCMTINKGMTRTADKVDFAIDGLSTLFTIIYDHYEVVKLSIASLPPAPSNQAPTDEKSGS